jgi:thymidylate synthase (FAD)
MQNCAMIGENEMAIKVTLLTHTPNPEQTVAMAAKLCYSASGIEDIRDGLTEEKTASFINMLADLGHASPTEHASFTFGIEGISRACSHQLVRHRIASYSQQSQRYVDGTKFDFVTPPEIQNNPKALEAYNKVLDLQSKAYKEIRDALVVGYIKENSNMELNGTDEEIMEQYKAENKKQYSAFVKKANEDARFILPNASTTKIVCTFNARSLQNFFAHRCCNRAQWEIREVAEQMLLQCLEVAPNLFKNCGPSCLFGPCPEGNMCCGKQKEVREKYGRTSAKG